MTDTTEELVDAEVVENEEQTVNISDIDGIWVRIKREGQSVSIDGIQLTGNVYTTEVQTVLELAKNDFRQKAGLN